MTKVINLPIEVTCCDDCPFRNPGFPSGWICTCPVDIDKEPPYRLYELNTIPSWCPLPDKKA